MNEALALRTLSLLMNWRDDELRQEYQWLRLMSRYKFDAYRDYLAGVRFLESLITWLRQFAAEDRAVAYNFVRTRLIYISAPELYKFAELFYYDQVEKMLVERVALDLKIQTWEVWKQQSAKQRLRQLRRQTLIIGLSDGARLDVLRRYNSGMLKNDQFVLHPEIDPQKWKSLIKALHEDLADPSYGLPKDARPGFEYCFLVDDFIGSSTTLLRQANHEWSGKLFKFHRSLMTAQEHLAKEGATRLFEPEYHLIVHHFLANEKGIKRAIAMDSLAKKELGKHWFMKIDFTYGTKIDGRVALSESADPAILAVAKKYYDPSIETEEARKHMKESGIDSLLKGYAECALPLVLEHNTPNNSVPLIWAASEGGAHAHRMRPLFRRRQRHGAAENL